MSANYTDLTVVLDKSGSMRELWSATINGYNNYLNQLAESGSEVVVTHYQFNSMNSCLYTAQPLDKCERLSTFNYMPGGNTALLDTVGDVIEATGDRLAAMPEVARPKKVLFVIITDGQENSSTRYNRAAIAQKISHQKSVYKWDFVFIGANQDSFSEGGQLNVSKSYIRNYTFTNDGTNEMWSSLARSSAVYCCSVGEVKDFWAGSTEDSSSDVATVGSTVSNTK